MTVTTASQEFVVLEGPYAPEQLPAQMIHPQHGKVLWLADPTAARMLAPQAK